MSRETRVPSSDLILVAPLTRINNTLHQSRYQRERGNVPDPYPVERGGITKKDSCRGRFGGRAFGSKVTRAYKNLDRPGQYVYNGLIVQEDQCLQSNCYQTKR